MNEISHLAHRLDKEDMLWFLLDLILRFVISWFDLTWHLFLLLVHFEEDEQSHMARQLRIILFAMYKRDFELNQIMDRLKIWRFEHADEPFKRMIFDIVIPEPILLTKCIPILEERALISENLWKLNWNTEKHTAQINTELDKLKIILKRILRRNF